MVLTQYQIFAVCSLLCSSDVIAAISMVSYKDQPKLFSIVYGEGVFNDIVSIILFNAVTNFFRPDSVFSAATPFIILGEFIALALASIAIGILIGVLASVQFKYMRFLTHSPITESLIIMFDAFISYMFAEAVDVSGIISLLVCGIIMAHYGYYNLSHQGRTITSATATVFGQMAEAFVFTYIGICLMTYDVSSEVGDKEEHNWSLSFILWMTLIIVVGRIFTVVFSHLICKCCLRNDVDWRELAFITWGGMIRGAIAFGLVLKIPKGTPGLEAEGGHGAETTNIMAKTSEVEKVASGGHRRILGIVEEASVHITAKESDKERGIIITSTLIIVIITTLFFGTFMKAWSKLLFKKRATVQVETKEENIQN